MDRLNLKGQKIAITGGAGFIGSHLVDAVLTAGGEVIVVDDFSTGRRSNIAHALPHIELREGSITDLAFLERALAGATAILHQAALPSVPKSVALPLETHSANSTGTLCVFMAAAKLGVKRVVYASSSSVYGDTAILPKVETMALDPLSPYAVHKATAELYAKVFHRLHGLETIGLRYFNVFGPRQNPDSEYAAVIPKFVTLMKQGQAPHIHGDGSQTRDFTFVDNVVDANLLALAAKDGFGTAYNIAAGRRVSLDELVEHLNGLLGTSLAPLHGQPRPGDIKDSYADIGKARKALGYEASVSFEEGLRRTVDSF